MNPMQAKGCFLNRLQAKGHIVNRLRKTYETACERYEIASVSISYIKTYIKKEESFRTPLKLSLQLPSAAGNYALITLEAWSLPF